MDFQQFLVRYSPFFKKNILVLSVGFLGLIFFAYGLIGLFFTNEIASEDIIFEASSEKNLVEAKTIFVDVGGAVVKPGLYKLSEDSRVQDGLAAAGGLSAAADREYIAKNLNLAAKLTDGAKIYIRSVGEATEENPTLNSGFQVGVENLINVNIASQATLETLTGIGPVTAQKIIEGRPYGSVDELLSKKIVGMVVFSQIKDKITVY